MTNRVNVNITARDLTRNALNSLSRNFRNVGQDMDRFIGQRTRTNFQRLSQSVNQARRDLQQLRGNIPDDEFFRLDRALRTSANRLTRGFGALRNNQRMLNRIRGDLDDFADTFNRVAASGQIRIRADISGLRRADAQLNAWRRRQGQNGVRVPVRPDPNSGRSFGRFLFRSLTSPIRLLTGVISGTLQDGVGQGLVQGVQRAGPIVGGLFIAAIVAAISLAGAAIAGALIFALGGAIAGLGIFLAAQSKQVKKEWASTLGTLKKDFQAAAEPMLPILDLARRKVAELGKDLAPRFRNALLEMQGPLTTFLESFERGFKKLIDIAGPDLKEAFNVFLEAFGPEFEDFLEEFGKSLAALARTVRDNSTEIAAALRIVLGIINFIIDAVNFLAQAWVMTIHGMIALVAALVDAFAFLQEAAFSAFDKILGAAEAGLGWIPGIGDQIATAREAFNTFADRSVEDLRRTADSIRGISDAIKTANTRNKLTADISQLTSKINDAKARLKTVRDAKTKAKIQADISQLIAERNRAIAALRAIDGTTATAYIITHSKTYRSVHDIVGKRTGGIIGARSGGVRSNLTMVGEDGPELVDLPAGSRVRSNQDSRRMVGGGPTEAGPMVVQINVDGRMLAEALVEPQRDLIRSRGGGDVQRFFGKGKAR